MKIKTECIVPTTAADYIYSLLAYVNVNATSMKMVYVFGSSSRHW